ncbi:hypothetical protein AMECASPLE_033376 [Ameca splendens]|uniref:Uncharacterized protein n=1 Tax=Ameca splendens TaxID=208324 RepID=A0ABV1AD79_9TELE
MSAKDTSAFLLLSETELVCYQFDPADTPSEHVESTPLTERNKLVRQKCSCCFPEHSWFCPVQTDNLWPLYGLIKTEACVSVKPLWLEREKSYSFAKSFCVSQLQTL